MKLVVNDTQYEVRFLHDTKAPIKATVCTVWNGEQEAGEGAAVCSSKDMFSKRVGRKVALSRALMSFPKDFRTAFWKAYLNSGVTYAKS